MRVEGNDLVSSMSPADKGSGPSSWWRADLAEVLSALCHHCSDLAGVLACSIVVRDTPREFFSAAGSTEWACALDDIQLSEEAGPTWECCTTGQASHGNGLSHRGPAASGLAAQAPVYGVVGCRAVPLSGNGETWGALTLYWGPSTSEQSLLTTGVAVAALAARAVEFQHAQDSLRNTAALAPEAGFSPDGDHPATPGAVDPSQTRDARATARDARADARDARADARDARAAARDARATARENEARIRDAAMGRVDPRTVQEQVQARRDRYAAARDRFHAKADRAASRLDRIVSANERQESSIDGLTGAYRRDAGMLELEHEVTRARRTGDSFVLAFVDVDNLKVRNDLHGHIAGDKLLRRIADTLRANVRSYDLVVRYGGDEFVCGFPALDVRDATERFARINEDLAAHDEASVAFGIAELQPGDSLTDLITRADGVMYAHRQRRAQSGAVGALVADSVPSHPQ
jgi:diguanylate cyclase (GGDEF)-like protein